MDRPATHPNMRTALANLASVAAGFAVGRGRQDARKALRDCIKEANAALNVPTAGVPVMSVSDPDALVDAYMAANGDWCALTAAVNRNAMKGSSRKRVRIPGAASE